MSIEMRTSKRRKTFILCILLHSVLFSSPFQLHLIDMLLSIREFISTFNGFKINIGQRFAPASTARLLSSTRARTPEILVQIPERLFVPLSSLFVLKKTKRRASVVF